MANDMRATWSADVIDRKMMESIARDAGVVALKHFSSLSNVQVESKGHLDLVTAADKEVEALLTASLLEAFPADSIYGEEGGEIRGTTGRTWVIDPIDGTFNFVRGGQNWGISIGLFENNQPVFGVIYAPVRDLMLSGGDGFETQMNGIAMAALPPLVPSQGSAGISFHPSIPTADRLEVVRFVIEDLDFAFRMGGSATLSLIEVAMGETDGYVSLGDSTWDVMAAVPILRNLGAVHSVNWKNTGLDEKLRWACGSEDFLKSVTPLLEKMNAAQTGRTHV
ncbi:inositol monophosphatase family protein [Pseudomonas syringae]|uniref:inositol monophosphatase family protein n=1 Tax=Pseudomonas syringae TaxID=317 RepID=UPI0006B9947C|nr:inositol monophosphatase family protein [Pseudomonas syringae]KPB13102.1 hypothetical protein AC518_5264 [Pseudomonas syringae pv. syringae]MCF5030113.1 inositol monophosphatase [Pseudomonas syringae]POD19786.1 arabinose phosphate phosphatase [Pseudomonas syringae pv. syringae]UQB21727.1 hypothetical protein I9H08_07920 [Pseudomonas syringae pv. syringae]WHN05906.1 inositol monophosphatase family protein [Pseudomonas syringae pv. syringae]